MRWVQSIAREIYGLFVDDGSFALAVLVCVALAVAVLPRLVLTTLKDATGPALFTALALILIESALRYARRGK